MINKLLPINSNRRNFLRSILESIFSPKSLKGKFNANSFKYFKKYANKDFKCNICNMNSTTSYDFPDLDLRISHKIGVLRETLQCKKCFETMRQRTLSYVFLNQFNDIAQTNFNSIIELSESNFNDNSLSILDTDSFSTTSNLLSNKDFYKRSFYDPEFQNGYDSSSKKFNINLEDMAFDDSIFDIVLSTEVMEHVRYYKKAHSEIYRVLKKGGLYIFTVPYIKSNYEHIELVKTDGEKDIYIVEPQYHGDPLNTDKGVLAYRVFGNKLKKEFEDLGFSIEFFEINEESKAIFEGDIFIAKKI